MYCAISALPTNLASVFRTQAARLFRAAGRVVLRINVNDEPLAFEVVKLNGFAVLVLEFEIYEAFTFFKCHDLPFASDVD